MSVEMCDVEGHSSYGLSVCLSVGLTHVRTYGNKKIRETINSMTIIISFQGVLF